MLTAIAAIGSDNSLGKDNALLWRLPDDLRRFRALTRGHSIIMGRKTLESFKSPLPERKHIVITRQTDYKPVFEGVTVVTGFPEALYHTKGDDRPYVIGGGEIYLLAMPYIQRLELTMVHQKFPEADTFFPQIDLNCWNLVFLKRKSKDTENEYDHTYYTYTKRI